MINLIVLFIGPPGAGKGFFSHWLVEMHRFARLSSGDICRKYADELTELGKKIDKLLVAGKLLPDSLISQIFLLELNEIKKNVVLDGFPRTKSQEIQLRRFLIKKHPKAELHIFFLDVEFELAKTRVSGRLICNVCGASYHAELMPSIRPKICDFDHNQLIFRQDANKFSDRWAEYLKKTVPMIKYLQSSRHINHFHKIDTNQTPDFNKDKFKKILNL